MSPIQQMLLGVGAVATKTYVDDVFSTFLYEGTGSAQSINNGIDLSGEGGMTWIKKRNDTNDHVVNDTVRGAGNRLRTNVNAANASSTAYLSAFNNNGFSVGTDSDVNGNGDDYSSFSFRKAPGFFDIVTYTGDGQTSQTISHSLGSVPGLILVKCLDSAHDWIVYHRSLGADYFLKFNLSNAATDHVNRWNETEPTSTQFTVGVHGSVNNNGDDFVAYLFAHDDQSFGEGGDASVIKCGSYVGNGAYDGSMKINLGWEPSFVLWKRSSGSEDWFITDSMRGISSSGAAYLRPNTNEAEASSGIIELTSTGWKILNSSNYINGSGQTYVYIAIRRPDGYVGKPVELGTGAFAMDGSGSGTTAGPNFDSNFPVDFALFRDPTSDEDWRAGARLMGTKYVETNNTDAEANLTNFMWDYNNGWMGDGLGSDYQGWGWKRHAGFDVVTTSGGQGKLVPHSLGKIPEMIWLKGRDFTQDWNVYHKGANSGTNPEQYGFNLNDTYAESQQQAYWNNVAPTATHFSTGTSDSSGGSSSYDYIVMLFASVDGISKVGYYDGNNTSTPSTQTITTGFQPRFIMIKRATHTGHWYVLDTVRGIPAGSTVDPALRLNTNEAQDSGYNFIESISSTGFTLSDSGLVNYGEASFIYYAHA